MPDPGIALQQAVCRLQHLLCVGQPLLLTLAFVLVLGWVMVFMVMEQRE